MRTIGIVSGAGSDYLADAVAAGQDAFLTGEPAERVMTHAEEEQIHFLAAGHYATETFGVRRLGELLAERFGDSPRVRGRSEPDLSLAVEPVHAGVVQDRVCSKPT